MSSNLRPFVWSTLLVRPGVFELVRISPNSFILISATGPLSASEAGIFNIWATHQPATLSWPYPVPTHSHLPYFSVIWMTIQPPNSCSLSDPFWSARHQILNFKVIAIDNCNLYPFTMYFQLKYSAPQN